MIAPLSFFKICQTVAGIYYDQSISRIKYIFPSFYSFARGKEGRCFGSNYSAFPFPVIAPLSFFKICQTVAGIYYDQSISRIKYIFPSFYSFARGKEGRCFGSNYSAGRTNENRIDLNRNFPTWKQKGQTISELKQVSF